MAESGTDLYIQGLAGRAQWDLTNAGLGYINALIVSFMLCGLLAGVGLLTLIVSLNLTWWLAVIAVAACMLGGALIGHWYGRRSLDRVWPGMLRARLARTRSVLIDQGTLRTIIENHPGNSFAALEPLLARNPGNNPGNQGKSSSDNMERRLRALVQHYDTLLARMPRLNQPHQANKSLAWWIAGGIVGLNAVWTILAAQPEWGLLSGVWLTATCLLAGGYFLARAVAVANLDERLRRLALLAVMVGELGSEAARALLPAALRSEMTESACEDVRARGEENASL